MRHLERYIRPYWGFIILTLIIKFMGAVFELMIPYLMEIILDDKIAAGAESAVYLYGGGMVLCALLAMSCNITANRMGASSSGKITEALRHDLFAKTQQLSARQMDKLTTSSAVSRLTSDSYNINRMLAQGQRMGIRAPIMLIGGVTMMLTMDAKLALILVALLPIIAVVVYFVSKHSIPLHIHQSELQDDVVRTVQENVTGVRVIKALSKTEYEKQRFETINTQVSDAGIRTGRITSITNPAATLVLNLGLTLVVLIGAFRVNSGATESGVLVAFLQYFTQILNAMLGVTNVFMMCTSGIASARRISAVLDEEEDLQVIAATGEPEAGAAHIEFRDVSFSYTGVGMNISHLSFRLEHGQTLGILGGTGSGKTTIISLLLRQYDPDEGQILIDGADIRTIDRKALRGMFGTVFQNDFVTEGDIAHNIRFFRQLEDADLQRAAEDAQATAFIAEKENGMASEVSVRGNNLSGGQKQRLLIARALAAKPEILVLDDASSALDYQTDANLRRALRKGYRQTTTVLVAQRISSLRHADLILMIHDGCVIGAGKHEQLMDTCEEYRIIADIQMGEGKEEF